MNQDPSHDASLFEALHSTLVCQGKKLCVLEVRHPQRLDEPPVAHLLLAREERYERMDDGGIANASISIEYEIIAPRKLFRAARRKGEFVGCYTMGGEHAWVSLTSSRLGQGAVFLDLPELAGHRIGTYLMNEIVSWAAQWPDAHVFPIRLRDGQATDDNKLRRNRFYTQFGIAFDFEDARERAGTSRDIAVRELNQVDTWRANIREHSIALLLREADPRIRRLRRRPDGVCPQRRQQHRDLYG